MAEQRARRDSNFVTTMIGVDNIAFTDPTTVAVDPTTHALLISGSITASPASNGLTGSAVPTSADYEGINVAGTLRGATGVNPSGSIYATQIDLASVGGTSFALGQQLAAASLPVVLTAAQITTLTPVSTAANLEVSGNITGNNANAFFQDATGYKTVSIVITGTWSGNLQSQGSNDNSNWFVTNLVDAQDFNNASHDFGDNRIWYGTITTRYFRIRSTSFSSGTAVVVAEFSSQGNAMPLKATNTQIKDSGGNIFTSNSTTPAAHFAIDSNITSILGTAPTTVGKMDIKGADGDVFVRNATAGNFLATVSIAAAQTLATVTTVSTVTSLTQFNGVAIALNTGAVSTGTLRVVEANDEGKTLKSAGGSAASSGNNTIVAAGTNKLKVFAFSLSTTSTSSTTCIFQSGAGGTELWRVVLQAATGTNTGANLAISPPASLFATASATLLNLNLSAANTVHWSVSYFDEA